MKYIRRFILYLIIASIHFLLQATMMLLSIISKLIFFEDSIWSMGGMLRVISAGLYQILIFPFIWIFQKWSFQIPWFQDLPFVLNSLLWGLIIYLLIARKARKKKKNARYYFVRGL
ncbi:hypothetical protein BBF96_01125 [Anoxybacter fermentans]|uniref:Uncharacterized protein n=1 Tax=Anoxybacter fermentans TaxID=1323375 RepID=A0A3S9SV06_9FIRM|nr:hypothetical protein [Anoxybacter fermentans]AZR72115.1 hypothetical protein BBF96_01125 [Anoxybacter fermentans]